MRANRGWGTLAGVMNSSSMPAAGPVTYVTHSPEETRALAGRLAGQWGPGTIVCLHGDLGLGKTCFAQGVARALDIRRPVSSPTFTLINEYRGRLPLAHVDLYRVRGAADAFSLGLDDYFDGYPGIVLLEWAERIAGLLPEECWHVELSAPPGGADNDRVLLVRPPGLSEADSAFPG